MYMYTHTYRYKYMYMKRLCGQLACAEATYPGEVILCMYTCTQTYTHTDFVFACVLLCSLYMNRLCMCTHTHTHMGVCMRLCGQMARGEKTDPEEVIVYGKVYLLLQQSSGEPDVHVHTHISIHVYVYEAALRPNGAWLEDISRRGDFICTRVHKHIQIRIVSIYVHVHTHIHTIICV